MDTDDIWTRVGGMQVRMVYVLALVSGVDRPVKLDSLIPLKTDTPPQVFIAPNVSTMWERTGTRVYATVVHRTDSITSDTQFYLYSA